MKTNVKIGTLTLKNPVLVASGTFGYGSEAGELIDVGKLGGVVTKSLSMNPRDGNSPPRIVETASGMLNSIGLANVGVKVFISDKLPYLRKLGTAIIANIAASSVEEYCAVLSVLEEQDGIDAYEINVSCPNVKDGGLSFGQRCDRTAEVTRMTRKLTKKPLIIKLTPNVAHISEFARAVADEGADAVSLINTVVGMAINIRTRRPKLSTVTGGLSGPAIKPIALAKVYEVSKNVSIPIIGMGGIMTADDAIEFFLAGSSAIQVGTANFVNPSAALDIIDGIVDYCTKNSIGSIEELRKSLLI
jgi:dihydroorotate dehydrogenase (NAD+) catalytic subunit